MNPNPKPQPPKPRKVTVFLPRPLWEQAKIICIKRDISLQQYMCEAILERLAHNHSGNPPERSELKSAQAEIRS